MKKNTILWVVVALVGVGLIFYSFSRPSPEVNTSLSPVPSPQQSGNVGTGMTEESFLGLHGIKAPATCQVGGEINFFDKDTFSSKDSKIAWQNIDSQGRLINWHIAPNDNLKIGPNLFGALVVPNGEYQNLTVRLPENPISKTYTLTVSVTYGQIIQDDVKVKETNCTGQVKVNLNF